MTPLEGPAPKYKKIVADPARMDEALAGVFLEAHREPPDEVILDVGATDDPLHGKQEGKFSHGVVPELKRIVTRLREVWPGVQITV